MALTIKRRGRPAGSRRDRAPGQQGISCDAGRPSMRGALHAGPRRDLTEPDVRTLEDARQLIGPLSAAWRAYLTVPLVDGMALSIADLAEHDAARMREGRPPLFANAPARAAAARLLSQHGIATIALRRTAQSVEYLIRVAP